MSTRIKPGNEATFTHGQDPQCYFALSLMKCTSRIVAFYATKREGRLIETQQSVLTLRGLLSHMLLNWN